MANSYDPDVLCSMRSQQALQREVAEMNLRMEQEKEYHQERVVEVGVALGVCYIVSTKTYTSLEPRPYT